MFHPDIQAALAKERRDTMLAEAAAARLARQARETRRHRRVPRSPEMTTQRPRLAGLPGASNPYGPAMAAAREEGK